MDPESTHKHSRYGELIYGIDVVDNNDVNIKMTMTTQGCPLHETLVSDVTRYAKKVPGVNKCQEVPDIVWDPPWTMDKLSDEAKATLKNMGAGMANTRPNKL